MDSTVKNGILKIVGVFNYNSKKDIIRFTQDGYRSMNLVDFPEDYLELRSKIEQDDAIAKTRSFYKNTYYSEFRDLLFTGGDSAIVEGFKKNQISKLQSDKILGAQFLSHPGGQTLSFSTRQQEVFLFPEDLGIFSISFDLSGKSLGYISDLINKARFFDSDVINESRNKSPFHAWISNHVLCGIPLVGNKLEVDEYSGSKFKTYTVIDLDHSNGVNELDRDHLLFEIGTSSRLGTIRENSNYKPSEEYYSQIMQNKLSAFANYTGLALLDSFTVIGSGNYKSLTKDNPDDYIQYHQWNRVYFGIYIFNLFVRYNLHKYNTKFLLDPVRYRNRFQHFINHYNFTQISFNFLPNLIFEKIRMGMGIDSEIEKFEKRLSGLASSIQEDQEKRQAFLLTLISVFSSFSAAKDIVSSLESTRIALNLGAELYYSMVVAIILLLATLLVSYLFPLLANKIKNKFSRFVSRILMVKK